MPQSLSKVIVHNIFSTKNREPWLDSAIWLRMHAYLSTICRDLGGEALRVADHVHIVTTLPRTLSQAELIEEIKKPSSKWIKALEARYRGFFWQRGYAVFSVARANWKLCCNTYRGKKSAIVPTLFRMNFMVQSQSWGDAPGCHETAPLALSRYLAELRMLIPLPAARLL